MLDCRHLCAVVALVTALAGCGDGANESGPDAATNDAALMVPTFEGDPMWPMIPNDRVFGITSGLSIEADNNV